MMVPLVEMMLGSFLEEDVSMGGWGWVNPNFFQILIPNLDFSKIFLLFQSFMFSFQNHICVFLPF